MCSIHIGICHDYDLIITKLIYIKVLMDTCTESSYHSLNLFILHDMIYTCLLDIKYLTS